MGWRPQLNERGVITRFSNSDTGEVISAQEYERRVQTLQGGYTPGYASQPALVAPGGAYIAQPLTTSAAPQGPYIYQSRTGHQVLVPPDNARSALPGQYGYAQNAAPSTAPSYTAPPVIQTADNPLITRHNQQIISLILC
jgi:hypothetical protein